MRKPVIALVLFIAAACKGSDGVEPLVTTTVLVASTPTQIAVGETAKASAVVKDQNGNPLSGKTIVWTSLNNSIATVSTDGVITGVAPGNATIKGTVDGVTGTATVIVVALVPSCSGGVTTVDLQPGDVRVISSAESGGCVKVASTSSPSSYILIAASTNAQPDIISTFTLKSDEGETVPNNSLLTTPYRLGAQPGVESADMPGAFQVRFEGKLRESERRDIDFAAAKRAYQSLGWGVPGRASLSTMTIPSVGDKRSFKVPKSCSNFTTVSATVKYVGTRSIVYADDASPAGGFVDSDYQDIATEFDNTIYPTDVDYFGNPSDLDENARVIILFTPEVNKLTPANAGGYVGGFFFVGDLLPATGSGACPQSNVGEIFYSLAPDPQGTINGNTRNTAFVRQGTRGTVAHELQHMINASERLRNPQFHGDLEAVWLDEGLSHTAEDLVGRATAGLTETGNYTFARLFSNVNDYNAFFFQNFARFREYLRNPGVFSPTSELADSSLAVRGAAWALVRYTADHYAPGNNVKAFLRSLTPGPDTGVVNLVEHAGSIPFDTLIAGWMVANYADDAGIFNLDPKYEYKTYNMRDNVARAFSLTEYPILVTQISGSNVSFTNIRVKSGSGNYFNFSRGASGLARSFRFLNIDQTSAASFAGASLILLRTF